MALSGEYSHYSYEDIYRLFDDIPREDFIQLIIEDKLPIYNDNEGKSIFSDALIYNSVEFCEILLIFSDYNAKGIEEIYSDEYYSYLFLVMSKEMLDKVDLLLKYGAKFEDNSGHSYDVYGLCIQRLKQFKYNGSDPFPLNNLESYILIKFNNESPKTFEIELLRNYLYRIEKLIELSVHAYLHPEVINVINIPLVDIALSDKGYYNYQAYMFELMVLCFSQFYIPNELIVLICEELY